MLNFDILDFHSLKNTLVMDHAIFRKAHQGFLMRTTLQIKFTRIPNCCFLWRSAFKLAARSRPLYTFLTNRISSPVFNMIQWYSNSWWNWLFNLCNTIPPPLFLKISLALIFKSPLLKNSALCWKVFQDMVYIEEFEAN